MTYKYNGPEGYTLAIPSPDGQGGVHVIGAHDLTDEEYKRFGIAKTTAAEYWTKEAKPKDPQDPPSTE